MTQEKGKTLVCSRCGDLYQCFCDSEKSCWCKSVKVSSQNLKMISELYHGCICPDCLNLFAEKKDKTCLQNK